MLRGYGNPEFGQWWERGARDVLHLRRRLRVDEWERVGVVKDLRGTPEAQERLDAAMFYLAAMPALLAAARKEVSR